MLVCLACYGDRVAALLETATELCLFREEQTAALTPCGVMPTPETGVLALIDLLAASDVEMLICGGLSGCALSALRQSGVAVAPWVGGTVEEVVRALAAGGLPGLEALRLPGCGLGNCQARRRGQGCRHGKVVKVLRARKSDQKWSVPNE